ncbi:tRNA(Met) cytidine acetyltransferase TmcA [Candidatus Colwellia aromaticivorans]|uniref:tRNA(Met) cytidine acetyltransferase TmcA n=1 Tax=Candidatus Colwellia aromaticivorans TaxID=2267621 RepID=UPI000DF4692F|nr:GNAT family N-acetyltransferase [Candidatus Colwellia aromaticivorans]
MLNTTFSQWFDHFHQQAKALSERRLIVLVGENEWAHSLLQTINSYNHDINNMDEKSWLIYGDSELIKANVSPQRFRDRLGTESDFVVFIEPQLTLDAFAALSGTLVAGGIMFLVINDMTLFKHSHFFKRFFSLLQGYSEHVKLEQEALVFPSLKLINQVSDKRAINSVSSSRSQALTYGCVTQEQVSAVEAITKVIKGKSKRPLVLTADRGRGKSSALAIACAQLLALAKNDNKLHIIITAAELNSVQIFFSQLAISLPQGHQEAHKFTAPHGFVEFVAVDKLLKLQPKVSLVLVDEAAAIPVYLLEQLLFDHSRLVFASTIHGYEGAGRGFTLKFQQTLSKLFPHWRSLHINEPIRWRLGDPLEQLVFDACLLNAELPNVCNQRLNSNLAIPNTQFEFKHFTAAELVADESVLRQVFAVLVTAHYQTKPSDVQMLLDNEQVQLVCLMSADNGQQQVIAVALLMHEGKYNGQGITEAEFKAVSKSKRRLRNNFIPQSLLTQCGVEQAFDYHYIRVMRIAVHPQVQHQGIGSLFLSEITTFSKAQSADFLASSFGATKPLLSFWLTAGFKLGRVGFSKDKASGEQSALVLKSLSGNSEQVLVTINTEFYRQFDYLLVEEYKHLATNLVALIQQYCPQSSLITLRPLDNANVEAFAHGYRQYSSCVFSLHLWLKQQLCNQHLNDEVLCVLISRIMQKHSVSDICSKYHFTGKKALEQFLKASVMSGLTGNC